MNRFLLLALTAGLLSPIPAEAFWWRKDFPSNRAFHACKKWEEAGGFYASEEKRYNFFPEELRDLPEYYISHSKRRECRLDDENNQYLGIEKKIKRGVLAPKGTNLDSEIKKHFRY